MGVKGCRRWVSMGVKLDGCQEFEVDTHPRRRGSWGALLHLQIEKLCLCRHKACSVLITRLLKYEYIRRCECHRPCKAVTHGVSIMVSDSCRHTTEIGTLEGRGEGTPVQNNRIPTRTSGWHLFILPKNTALSTTCREPQNKNSEIRIANLIMDCGKSATLDKADPCGTFPSRVLIAGPVSETPGRASRRNQTPRRAASLLFPICRRYL